MSRQSKIVLVTLALMMSFISIIMIAEQDCFGVVGRAKGMMNYKIAPVDPLVSDIFFKALHPLVDGHKQHFGIGAHSPCQIGGINQGSLYRDWDIAPC